MENEKKLLVSDYDLTYDIDDYFSIVHNTKKIKNFMKNGNIFAFATMRNFNNLKTTIFLFNLKYNYLSLCGGRVILNKNNEIIFKRALSKIKIEEILATLSEYTNDVEIAHMYGIDLDSSDDIIRIVARIKNSNMKKEIMGELEKISGIRIIESFGYINILESDIDKKDSIQFIADIENIKRENIWTVGDSSDDLGMIREYNGYASIFGTHECKKNALGTIISVGNLSSKIDNGFARVRKL